MAAISAVRAWCRWARRFSVPDQGQLEQYFAGFDADLTAGSHILLTLMDPGFDAKNWRVRRYADLADAIDAQLSGIDTSNFAGHVVCHYVYFIRLLQRVMDTVGTPAGGDPLPLPRNQAQLLDAIRMDAAVQKARASWVAAEIRRQLGRDAGEVRINSGFTNSRALLEGFCEVPDVVDAFEADPHKRDSIGWQLQGDQFTEEAERTELVHEEPRTLAEILEAEKQLFDKIWYVRRLMLKEKIEAGEHEALPMGMDERIEAAMRAIEERYGADNVGPWDDWGWGFLHGKLSALRWVLGSEWDFLDT
jgi:hypothetical protein